jgi:hypothetical protein
MRMKSGNKSDRRGARFALPITVLAALPAFGWFLLVVLRWFGITEQFTVLESTLEGTGAALVRGVILFVALPLIGAAVGFVGCRGGDRRRILAVYSIIGVLLAVANVVTRNTGL